MPTYEFICSTCKGVFEVRRPYEERDAPLPGHEGHECRRVWLTPPGIAFLGPGWTGVERYNREQAEIKARADREWEAEHEIGYQRDLEKACNEARDPTDAENELADRAARAFAREGSPLGAF